MLLTLPAGRDGLHGRDGVAVDWGEVDVPGDEVVRGGTMEERDVLALVSLVGVDSVEAQPALEEVLAEGPVEVE